MFRKETHTTSSSMSSMMQQTTIMESSHMTKVVTSDGVTDEKKHTMSTSASSQVKKATGEPTVEVFGSHMQEVKQETGASAVISDKVSFVKKEGDRITHQIEQDSSSSFATVMPQPKKLVAGKKKLAPARFIVPLQGVIANDGDRVVLECTIDGHPEPTVTWTRNGGPVSEDAQIESRLNKAMLILPNVSQSQSGHYTCIIKNDAGMAQCTCDVIIKKTQFPPVISKRLHPAVVSVGERLHMEIDVTGTPPPEVLWMKDGIPLSPSEHINMRSEGTRHLLVIQQVALSDSGRYSAVASNPAGRAESLADVRVTQPVMQPPSESHTIIFTDTLDETKSISDTIEEGYTKTVKRAIEEVTVEATSPPSPAKILKPQPKPVPLPLPMPPNYQPQSPEPTEEEEEEVRRPPGKLKTVWPPLPSEEDEYMMKCDPGLEITSKNVSSIISSFSATAGETDIVNTRPPKALPKSRPKSVPIHQRTESDIHLQPEPEPEYGYILPEEHDKPVPEPMVISESSPVDVKAKSPEYFLAPEPLELSLERESSPEYVLAPEPEPEIEKYKPEKIKDEDSPQQSSFINLVKQEYRKAMINVTEPSKILSPIPEIVPEIMHKNSTESDSDIYYSPEPKVYPLEVARTPSPEPPKILTMEPPTVPTPEPLKVPTPEPHKPTKVVTPELSIFPSPETPKLSCEEFPAKPISEPVIVPTIEPQRIPSPQPLSISSKPPQIISEVKLISQDIIPVVPTEPGDTESKIKREIKSEAISSESTFFESKKSVSTSSFSTFETKVYTSGISSSPVEPSTVDTVDTKPEATFLDPYISQVPSQVEADQSVFSQPEPVTYTEDISPPFLYEAKDNDTYVEEPPVMESSVESEESLKPFSSEELATEQSILESSIEAPTEESLQVEFAESMKTGDVLGTGMSLEPSSSIVEAEPGLYSQIDADLLDFQESTSGKPLLVSENNSQYTTYSSDQSSYAAMSTQMETTFVTSADVKTKIFSQPMEQPQPQNEPLRQEPQIFQPMAPMTDLPERTNVEEIIKPPRAPERDEGREQKKPKKKRESVIQLAKRLEETIIPMSPDEVPGGIRMFPSPKQPSTPIRESPTTVHDNAASQATPTNEEEIFAGFKAERFPDLEPFPFVVKERPRTERPRSMPPPLPRKFVPGSFTDSEYESDMETDQRLNIQPLKFEASVEYKPEPLIPTQEPESFKVPKPRPVSFTQEFEPPKIITKPRPLSVGRDPLPPYAFGNPPLFEGGMRPDVLKKEDEPVKEVPKSVTPKKKSKLVEKFLSSTGQTVEETPKPLPQKTKKKEVLEPPKAVPIESKQKDVPLKDYISHVTSSQDDLPRAVKPQAMQVPVNPEKPKDIPVVEKSSPKPMVDIDTRGLITPSKLAKVWPPPESDTGEFTKQSYSKSSYSESKTMTSSSYQKMESKITEEYSQSTSEVHRGFATSQTRVQPKPEPIPTFEWQSAPSHVSSSQEKQKPKTEPVLIPEVIPAIKPDTVQIVKPEPVPVDVPELVPVAEPEPMPVDEPEPMPVDEPEPVPVVEPISMTVVQPELVSVVDEAITPLMNTSQPDSSPIIISDSPQAYIQEPATCKIPASSPYNVPMPSPVLIPEPACISLEHVPPEREQIFLESPKTIPVQEPIPETSIERHPGIVEEIKATQLCKEQITSKDSDVSQSVLTSPTPGFRSVRAPTPKRGQTPGKSAPAPPPPFDMVPLVLEAQPPKSIPQVQPEPVDEPIPLSKAEPVVKSLAKPKPVIKTQPKVTPEVIRVAEEKPPPLGIAKKTEKKPEGGFVPKKVPTGGKMLPVWPPKLQEEPSKPLVSVKVRSQSLERPPVTEAPSLPVRPHEAPPAVYWSSNVTLQEKKKPWPQPASQSNAISSSLYQTTTKTQSEKMQQMSQHRSESLLTTQVKIEPSVPKPASLPVLQEKSQTSNVPDLTIPPIFASAPSAKTNVAVYPPIHKVPVIEPKKETVIKSPTPLKEGTVISTIIPLPPLEPFPFEVKADRGKQPRGRAPSVPKRFIPGSFTESEYESDYESAPSPVSRLYLSDSEALYKPLNMRLRRGRSRQPRNPSPPPPSALGPPQPFDNTLSRATSLFPDDRIHPQRQVMSRSATSQSKNIIQTVKLVASQITPEIKSTESATIRPVQPQIPVAAPATIPKAIPTAVNIPSSVSTKLTSSSQLSSNIQQAYIKSDEPIEQNLESYIVENTEVREKGVKNIRKKFESSGPAPVPQGVHIIAPTAATLASPSNIAITSKNIPVPVDSDGCEDSSATGSLKKKPASPKSRKKTENTQITALEQEESGYVADTEGTLPRKHTKTTQSSSTSSSFSKSESFMSASFSKSENKSFSSTEFGNIPSSSTSFPMGSAFPLGGGMAPNGGIFSSTSFPMPTPPASSIGQTSQYTSSFKSTESKSSQVKKLWSFPR
ncbi:hypothetical protein SK128_020283 [Halocaridina rubra]|uniref:Ig-like domain-containing protein n=1 Tax=Halocaridina rubra TaxID=373956 RepID=A0AAN8ZTS9_HALRR